MKRTFNAALYAALSLTLVLLISILSSKEVQAHPFHGVDSINNRGYVVVNNTSRYTSAVYDSMAWWNRFHVHYDRRGPAFIFAKNTSMGRTIKIVEVYGACNAGYSARYVWRSQSVDLLKINQCLFKRYSGFDHRVAIGHELGHSFGFGHTPLTRWYINNSIMAPTMHQPKQYPRYHDRMDYYNRFIR